MNVIINQSQLNLIIESSEKKISLFQKLINKSLSKMITECELEDDPYNTICDLILNINEIKVVDVYKDHRGLNVDIIIYYTNLRDIYDFEDIQIFLQYEFFADLQFNPNLWVVDTKNLNTMKDW